MLSGVLRSPRAVKVNVEIMRAFVRLREALSAERGLHVRMRDAEAALRDHDRELTEHEAYFNELFARVRKLPKH